jgi:peptidyl-dipeptidase Dcp
MKSYFLLLFSGLIGINGVSFQPTSDTNPLLHKWTGPYNGIPRFDLVKIEHFKPALEVAMAEYLQEVERIATSKNIPTFGNTIAALERSGQTYNRVSSIYQIWSSTMNDSAFQVVEREMAPRLAEFSDMIIQNTALFKRIETVYHAPARKKLTAEQQRLVWDYYTEFVQEGAKLNNKAKAKVAAINKQLADLFTRFGQNLRADEAKFLELKTEAELEGLPPSVKAGAAADAESKGLKGSWIIRNTRSSVEPFLTYSSRRDLREKVFQLFVNRGDNADERDNNKIISEILQLRAERARLLGFPTHAHWRLQKAMAKTPEKAMELMTAVWQPAVAKVKEEVADMQERADQEGAGLKIEPWDYRYYAEKVRKAKYDLDQNEVKEYLQLEKLREGMFWVAGELFNYSFSPLTDVPVYHPDVRVWRVDDKVTGRQIGLWYFDPYAREGKSSGAWMNTYRKQQNMDGPVTTIVSNNSNFIKGKPGEPVLISWEDAITLFHEFGHALHGLSSRVTYPSLSGTAVSRDYVEFPSQVLERWVYTPEVLQRFALHFKTGEPMPQKLAERIKSTSKFNQGFITVEYLSAALVDMKLHLAGSAKIDPDAFEKETLSALGMPKEIVMRHRTPQFAHVFSGDSYSAGYYSYLWSDVISADAYQAFTDAKGPYDKTVAKRLYTYILSVGNTVDPAAAYRNFRGREPKIEALMLHRGFPVRLPKPVKKEVKKTIP